MGERVLRKESDIEVGALAEVARRNEGNPPLDMEKLGRSIHRGIQRRREWAPQIEASLKRQRESESIQD